MDELSRLMDSMGITLPGGIQEIHLLYVSAAAFILLILVLMVARKKRRPVQPSVPTPASEPAAQENNTDTREPASESGVEPDMSSATPFNISLNPAVQARLTTLESSDSGLSEDLVPIRQLLDAGDVDAAVEALSQIGEVKHGTGRDLRNQADQCLSGATTIHLVSGDLRLATGDLAGAIAQFARAIETVPRDHDILLAECLNKHGAAAYNADQLDTAAGSFKRAARILERIRGLNHPDVATAVSNLAMLHYARGDLAAAEPLYRRALEIDETVLGENSHEVATDLNNMALLLKKQERFEEAAPLLERALQIKEDQFDAGHPSLVTGLRNYAGLLRDMGRIDEAEVYEARVGS